MDEIFERVRTMLAEQLEIDEDRITMDSNIMEDFDADSLDVVDMVMSRMSSASKCPTKRWRSCTLWATWSASSTPIPDLVFRTGNVRSAPLPNPCRGLFS